MIRPDRSSVCLLVLASGGAAASALFLLGQQQGAVATITGACWFVIVALVIERRHGSGMVEPTRYPPTPPRSSDAGPPSSGQRALNRGLVPWTDREADDYARLGATVPPCAPHRLSGCMMCARRMFGARRLPSQDAEPTVMVRTEERR